MHEKEVAQGQSTVTLLKILEQSLNLDWIYLYTVAGAIGMNQANNIDN